MVWAYIGAVMAIVVVFGCRAPKRLHLATTTSVEASGLLARLVPAFEQTSGLRVHVIVAGTGQALKLFERGDVAAALSHDPQGEKQLVARGLAERVELMENHFLLVGPRSDPAQARSQSLNDAMRAIAKGDHLFVSRGDDSGTHRKEKKLWSDAGVASQGPHYRESGQGMSETLTLADEQSAYTLVDSSTWAVFHGKIELVIITQGDPRLRNVYSLLWRSPSGRRLALWLQSTEAHRLMSPRFRPIGVPPP